MPSAELERTPANSSRSYAVIAVTAAALAWTGPIAILLLAAAVVSAVIAFRRREPLPRFAMKGDTVLIVVGVAVIALGVAPIVLFALIWSAWS